MPDQIATGTSVRRAFERRPTAIVIAAVATAIVALAVGGSLLPRGAIPDRAGLLGAPSANTGASEAGPSAGSSRAGAQPIASPGSSAAPSSTSPRVPAGPKSTAAPTKRPTPTPRPAAQPPTNLAASPSTVYMHYYLWWTPQHWRDKLGTAYPYAASPAPAPGGMDASGCNPTVRYPGATIVDVPSEGLYDQGNGATFDRHIAAAVGAGITGFLVDWQGTGASGQGPSSSGYDARLDLLVSRVDRYNAAHGTRFRLALALDAFGNYGRPASALINDLNYFRIRYASNPAFANRYSSQPVVMLMASRRFALGTIQAVGAAERPHLLLLGDETTTSWGRDAASLDGTGYYWSSQDPWRNPQSGSQIASLARQVHAAGKAWFAPFTGGYNTQLGGGSSCVPRNGVRTLDAVWRLNVGSRPQGWFGISWNEFVENTYLEPSVTYGRTYLNEIARLIRG